MREQRRDIDINRGQGRARACFVIRAPLTSEVVNLRERCPDRAPFEAISDFSRGTPSAPLAHPSSRENATRWRHRPPPFPVGCAPVPPFTERRIMLSAIRYTAGYARRESTTISMFAFDRSPFFVLAIRPGPNAGAELITAKDRSARAYPLPSYNTWKCRWVLINTVHT